MNDVDLYFIDEVKANFQIKYMELKNQNLDGDSIFYDLLEFAQGGTTTFAEEAASLTILCYLFELCDVFEKWFLPTKYLKEHETLLGIGVIILKKLTSEKTLSELWETSKNNSNTCSYERFILALDMLFIFGVINIKDNKLMRIQNDS